MRNKMFHLFVLQNHQEWFAHTHSTGIHVHMVQIVFPSGSEVKNPPEMQEETPVWSLGQEGFLEEEMASHSSILAWKIPWTEEPDGLQSVGSQSQTQLNNWPCMPGSRTRRWQKAKHVSYFEETKAVAKGLGSHIDQFIQRPLSLNHSFYLSGNCIKLEVKSAGLWSQFNSHLSTEFIISVWILHLCISVSLCAKQW